MIRSGSTHRAMRHFFRQDIRIESASLICAGESPVYEELTNRTLEIENGEVRQSHAIPAARVCGGGGTHVQGQSGILGVGWMLSGQILPHSRLAAKVNLVSASFAQLPT